MHSRTVLLLCLITFTLLTDHCIFAKPFLDDLKTAMKKVKDTVKGAVKNIGDITRGGGCCAGCFDEPSSLIRQKRAYLPYYVGGGYYDPYHSGAGYTAGSGSAASGAGGGFYGK